MQPKFLVGPSMVIFGMIAALTIGLLLMRPAQPDPNESKFEAAIRAREMPDADTVEQLASQQLKNWFMKTAFKGIFICVIVCLIPIKRGMAMIIRPALFGLGSFVAYTLETAQSDPLGTMIKLGVIGGIAAVIVAVMRSFQTAFPDSNTPAHYRWSRALKENTIPEDDPASLERLENLRAAAAAPRRVLS